MQPSRASLLCRYHYDPLDRLADRTAQGGGQCFYLKDRLATEIQGARRSSIIQHEDQLLAVHQRQSDTSDISLLATDQQRSILNLIAPTESSSIAYTPYGHRYAENGLLSLLAFNGQRPDPLTGHYLLGNGYRAFNPVLMRFNSPDSLSPFGDGGLNAYVYCGGEPLNRTDDSGHMWKFPRLRSSNNGFSPLRRTSDSTTSLNSVAGAAGPVGPVERSSEPHQRAMTSKEIRKIKDPLNRNEAKLKKAQDEHSKIEINFKEMVEDMVAKNHESAFFLDKKDYELLVREHVLKRMNTLKKREKHYTNKISDLKNKASEVRTPNN